MCPNGLSEDYNRTIEELDRLKPLITPSKQFVLEELSICFTRVKERGWEVIIFVENREDFVVREKLYRWWENVAFQPYIKRLSIFFKKEKFKGRERKGRELRERENNLKTIYLCHNSGFSFYYSLPEAKNGAQKTGFAWLIIW